MAFTRTFIKSLSGGFIIGLGGAVFLSQDNKFLGALMFSLGLLAICTTDQYLFTGKISYTSDKMFLANVLIGNYIGATFIGWCLHYLKPEYVEKARAICTKKITSEGFLVVPLGILCNILIYLAVEGYKSGQTVLLILCVMAFILCGFEHCVANMFYFAVAGMFKLPFILLNVLGNAIGGMVVYKIREVQKFN